jgi:2'-5' RNA ligase
MRLSLAIDAHQFDLSALKKLKIGLNQSNIDYKWVQSETLHIDLIAVEEFDLEKIKSVVERFEPFTLKLDGVWAYPEQKEARILWVGVQNSRELQQLRFELFNSIEGSEMNNPADYKPILPVVRFRNYRNVTDLISPFKNTRFPELIVNRLVLIDMVSGGAYPTYKILEEFEMNKGSEEPSLTI